VFRSIVRCIVADVAQNPADNMNQADNTNLMDNTNLEDNTNLTYNTNIAINRAGRELGLCWVYGLLIGGVYYYRNSASVS
jgi:hypothetical protein